MVRSTLRAVPLPTRDDYQLEPGLVFLNHGSFGAVPRVVQAEYERLQREMERNPVRWLGRRADELLGDARRRLGEFVGAPADDLVLFPNPTTAINMVVRSLRLEPGDEVLTTDHEYGAMVRTWRRWCGEHGVRDVPVPVPLPVTTHADMAERVWSAVTPRTRVLFVSHLTSATALTFPVGELCRRAAERGILTIVDGAHAPGQLPLDLGSLGCDLYTGALHKWCGAPKGCAFLYARPEVQPWLGPLVTSWGWESERPGPSPFIDLHQWQGTRDLSPFLAVAAALDFIAGHDWPAVQAEGHRLALLARERVDELTGLPPICPPTTEWLGQMAAIRLPDGVDVEALKGRLYDRHHVEVPCLRWNGNALLRVSCAAYTTEADVDALVAALAAEL